MRHVTTNKPFDVDSPGTLVAVVALSCVGISVLLLAPVILGQVVQEFALSPRQGAYLISTEMVGIAFAALPAMFWLNRANWRIVLRIALCGSAFFLLLSTFCTEFTSLAVTRFFGGLSSGTAVSIGLATCGLRCNTERAFGVCIMGQLLFGALGLALFPYLMSMWGVKVLYLVLALFTMICLSFVPWVPLSSNVQTRQLISPEVLPMRLNRALYGSLAIVGLYLFYVSLNGVWTFLDPIGLRSALTSNLISYILSVGSVVGIAGAASATVLNTRWGNKLPPGFGVAMVLTAFFLLKGEVSVSHFLIAICLFKFAWTFTLPYYLAGIAGSDPRGRMIVIGNIFVGGGLATGPLIAAQLWSDHGNDRLLNWASLAMLASFLVSLPVLLNARWPTDSI